MPHFHDLKLRWQMSVRTTCTEPVDGASRSQFRTEWVDDAQLRAQQ